MLGGVAGVRSNAAPMPIGLLRLSFGLALLPEGREARIVFSITVKVFRSWVTLFGLTVLK